MVQTAVQKNAFDSLTFKHSNLIEQLVYLTNCQKPNLEKSVFTVRDFCLCCILDFFFFQLFWCSKKLIQVEKTRKSEIESNKILSTIFIKFAHLQHF